MKTIIICSLNDSAGTNIRERLLEKYAFSEDDFYFDGNPVYKFGTELILVSSRSDIVFVDNLDDQFHDCRFVFISRHRAESGIPSLTAHFTGNFEAADIWRQSGRDCEVFPLITEKLPCRSQLSSLPN